jgi:hypothetical protein
LLFNRKRLREEKDIVKEKNRAKSQGDGGISG